jgi:hypothetical protein
MSQLSESTQNLIEVQRRGRAPADRTGSASRVFYRRGYLFGGVSWSVTEEVKASKMKPPNQKRQER